MIPKIDPNLFEYKLYEPGSLLIIGFKDRFDNIDTTFGAEIFAKYCIGYCNGENLQIRPRSDTVGVMFFKDENKFWFHINKDEFENINKLLNILEDKLPISTYKP